MAVRVQGEEILLKREHLKLGIMCCKDDFGSPIPVEIGLHIRHRIQMQRCYRRE